MQIDAVRLFHLALPGLPAAPQRMLCSLHSGDRAGWGEVIAPPLPVASSDWAAGIFLSAHKALAPLLLGHHLDTAPALHDRLAAFHGHLPAKALFDLAWWDLASQVQGRGLADLVAAAHPGPPALAVRLLVPQKIDDLLAQVAALHQAGLAQIALALGPGQDLQPVRAVRQEFADVRLAVDLDGQLTLAQRDVCFRLDDFFLDWIEQPHAADDAVAHALLQPELRTPLALHQSVSSLPRVEQLLDLGAGRVLKVEPACVGGLTPALAIGLACRAAQVRAVASVEHHGPWGARFGAALALAPGFDGMLADLPAADSPPLTLLDPALRPDPPDPHAPPWSLLAAAALP